MVVEAHRLECQRRARVPLQLLQVLGAWWRRRRPRAWPKNAQLAHLKRLRAWLSRRKFPGRAQEQAQVQ